MCYNYSCNCKGAHIMQKTPKSDEELISTILAIDSQDFHMKLNEALAQKRIELMDKIQSEFLDALTKLRKFKTDDQIAREFLTLPRAGRKPSNHTLPLNQE